MASGPIKVTELELSILQQIWNCENSATVNEILERWTDKPLPGYTTVLKTLQKMEQKKIVGHESAGKRYKYFSKVTKKQLTKNRLGTIISRIFSGDKISFAQHFLQNEDFNAQELKELKKLIQLKEKELSK